MLLWISSVFTQNRATNCIDVYDSGLLLEQMDGEAFYGYPPMPYRQVRVLPSGIDRDIATPSGLSVFESGRS